LEEVSLLFHSRPLLWLFVAFGTPALSPGTPFRDADVLGHLVDQVGLSLSPALQGRASQLVLLIFEHILAAGAAANIILLSYQFGFRTCLSWGCNSYFHPLIWSLVSILVYGFHTAAMSTRIGWKRRTSFWRRIWSVDSQHSTECIVWKRKTLTWAVISPLASIGCTLILVYGTFVFSASLFVGSVDAIFLAFRIVASALACRTIIALEMSKLANVRKINEAQIPSDVVLEQFDRTVDIPKPVGGSLELRTRYSHDVDGEMQPLSATRETAD
jgi:hypothetical protein